MTVMPPKTEWVTRDQFVARLEKLINDSDKTQKDMAIALGYDQPNIITMFKVGTTRVPLEKVPDLARILGADPQRMLIDWFDAYMPGVNGIISRYLAFTASPAEKTWIAGLRSAFPKGLPPFHKWMAGPIKKVVAAGPPKSAT